MILDVSDPFNVSIINEYDDNLTGGVHNVFIYEDHIYALSASTRYDIINISDPSNPFVSVLMNWIPPDTAFTMSG